MLWQWVSSSSSCRSDLNGLESTSCQHSRRSCCRCQWRTNRQLLNTTDAPAELDRIDTAK